MVLATIFLKAPTGSFYSLLCITIMCTDGWNANFTTPPFSLLHVPNMCVVHSRLLSIYSEMVKSKNGDFFHGHFGELCPPYDNGFDPVHGL